MKNKIFIFGLTIGLIAKSEVQSQIDKFELSTCVNSKKKCIQITADKAQSGSISPNMLLKNISIEIKNNKNKVIEFYHNEKGFYDIEANRIILSKLIHKDTLKETVIYLKDLDTKSMVMR